jgi:hypothetical protein
MAGEDFTLDDLAAGLSPFHLSRRFREQIWHAATSE